MLYGEIVGSLTNKSDMQGIVEFVEASCNWLRKEND